MLNRKPQAIVYFSTTSNTWSDGTFCVFKDLSATFDMNSSPCSLAKMVEAKIAHFEKTYPNIYYKIIFYNPMNAENERQLFRDIDSFKKFLDQFQQDESPLVVDRSKPK